MISDWTGERRAIIRDATGVGIAVAAYGVVFGAQGVATGLSLAQTMTLSLLMFTGASQFALVGVLGAGGTGVMAALTALMLGAAEMAPARDALARLAASGDAALAADAAQTHHEV